MKRVPQSSASSGCAVVLEPESSWPARAFAATADCDRVVVTHVEPNLGTSRLVERIAKHSAEFERSTAKLRTIILACAGCDRESNERRLALVRALLPLLTSGEGRLVLTSDPITGPSNAALLELVGTMLGELRGRSITFLANDQEVATPRTDSGIFSVDPETHRDHEPDAWLRDDRLREAVDEAS